MSLGDLRSEITAVDALIAAGDGTEEYRECLGEMWRYEHVFQGERRVPPESAHQLASGTPAGTVVHLYSGDDYGPRYNRKLIQGVDKDLFRAVRVDDDDRPDNGYRIGDAIARPLPAGMYRYKSYYQDYAFIPCNFVPYNWYRIRYVTVTAPAGGITRAILRSGDGRHDGGCRRRQRCAEASILHRCQRRVCDDRGHLVRVEYSGGGGRS